MRRDFLPFSPPLIGEEEINEVIDTLRSDWITTGPKVRRFEREFAEFVDSPAALATNSGTDAMLVGLAALGIVQGDAVITTPMTFCSTVHVIEHMGATPVLVDVEADTLNISPERIAEVLDRPSPSSDKIRFRAILPVHLYGHPCEMDPIVDMAAYHGLDLLEDAAHALPAKYKGRTIGQEFVPAHGGRCRRLVAFSFYATKNMTTGEGGMLTGDPDLIDSSRVWSLHGISRDAYKRYVSEGSWHYEVVSAGFKCNMTDIQAAIGLHQMQRLPELQKRRREIVYRYHEAFAQIPELERPCERTHVESAWHLYVIRLNLDLLRIDRAQFISELKARNIGASVHFIPVHLHKYYREKYGYKPDDLPVAFREFKRIVSLPLNPRMSDKDADDVIEAVVGTVATYRR